MTERRKGCPECRSHVDFDPLHDLTCGPCRRMVERVLGRT